MIGYKERNFLFSETDEEIKAKALKHDHNPNIVTIIMFITLYPLVSRIITDAIFNGNIQYPNKLIP